MNSRYINLPIFPWTFVFILVYSSHAYSETVQTDKPLIFDSQMRKSLVENIIRQLQLKYVAPKTRKRRSAMDSFFYFRFSPV